MKRSGLKKIVSIVCASAILVSFAACKNKDKNDDAEESEESEISQTVPEVTTTEATTSLTMFSGPLPASDIAVTWTETEIDQTVRYASITAGEFLRVRKGPGTEYDIVGSLTRNQEVVVIAVTSDGWYKTLDGFYVSGSYLTESPS